jgi:hypothetical protein
MLKAMEEKKHDRDMEPDPESSEWIQGSGTLVLSGQEYLAGVDSNVDGGSICLLTLDPLDVDSQLGPVALDNLADLENISLKIQRAAIRQNTKDTKARACIFFYLF